ncbi:hypothetical protein [Algoriphagus antarcticus]|uniref:Uncharacterized protein n=1 Tax=Algoriphagus antarcticus TaxID=238540 RepID=A0A3E0D6P7_9BACT|nr:hypothetical protein [Algoriphagus antarcticus]REG78234.1 hypothetical protein C8N25_13928 [Algoriphagus antarcticus]
MSKLVASTFIDKGSIWLYLDDELIAKGSETVTMDLPAEEEFILHWFVKAPKGTTYSISISSPKEAQYQLTKITKESGKDFGIFTFSF